MKTESLVFTVIFVHCWVLYGGGKYHWFVPLPAKETWGRGIQKYLAVHITLLCSLLRDMLHFIYSIMNFYSEIAVRKPVWRFSDDWADFHVRSCFVSIFPVGFGCFTKKLCKAVKPWIHTPNPLAFQASHLYQPNIQACEVVSSLSSLKQF